jgi:molybdopterin synthase sulfur carrier subunit
MITIRYFARLREDLGSAEEAVALPAGVNTVGGLRDWLIDRGPPWRETLSAPAVLIAVNHETAGPAVAVQDGDEVAFFPPVTGG